MNAYTFLADVYDELMSDVDYKKWTEYLHAFLKQRNAMRIYEAGCGTGSITFELYRHGYDIIASDISPSMLKVASERARKRGYDITFIRQDMREIEVANSVDAIVCACDGPNYLNHTGVGMFACSAYNALNPGGLLLFDISTRYKLVDIMDGQIYFDDGEDTVCIWMNTYETKKNFLRMDVTLFLRNGDFYERLSEQHVQYAHDINSVRKIMLSKGFATVDVFDCFTLNPYHQDAQRVQFICIKE
ncbi:MAG: class I SAM-dependent DNA methyltransferase [Christensenellales bacterium]